MLTLLLIPALGCDGELYEHVVAELSKLVALRTLVVDDATLAECATQALSKVEDEFIVAGTSFGGNVALEVALAAPDRVKALWIMGSNVGAPRDPAAGVERSRALRSGRFDAVVDQLAEHISYRPGPLGDASRNAFVRMCGRLGPERMARQNDALVIREDRWRDLPRIACPALLLWGREDQFTPADDGLRMTGLMPDARFAEIADCGHLPTLEAPEEVVDAASHWLKARVL